MGFWAFKFWRVIILDWMTKIRGDPNYLESKGWSQPFKDVVCWFILTTIMSSDNGEIIHITDSSKCCFDLFKKGRSEQASIFRWIWNIKLHREQEEGPFYQLLKRLLMNYAYNPTTNYLRTFHYHRFNSNSIKRENVIVLIVFSFLLYIFGIPLCLQVWCKNKWGVHLTHRWNILKRLQSK